jgi:hypothetical protein
MATVNFWGSGATTVAVDAAAADQGFNGGLVFKCNLDGDITHLRYYETANAQGTVDLRLIDTSATVLASVQHTAVNGNSGWRDVALATPYTVTPGTWMMVYYHVPIRAGSNGTYATVNGMALSTVRTSTGSEMETADDGAVSFASNTGNGRYDYGALGTPDNTFGSENYTPDVVFESVDPNPTIPSTYGESSTRTTTAASPTSISVNYPANLAEGDLVVAEILLKPNTATVATPANWTLVGEHEVGGGTQGAGTGALSMWLFTREVPSGGLSGSQSFTLSGSPSTGIGGARSFKFPASGYTDMAWEALTTDLRSRTTASTTYGGIGGANLNIDDGDWVVITSLSSDDANTSDSFSAISATGATFGSIVTDPATTTVNSNGNDASLGTAYVPVTGGPSSAAINPTITGGSSETGGWVAYRVRATGIADTGPPEGAASGTYDFSGSATGSRDSSGSASGTYAFNGTAVGEAPPNAGAATGTYDFSGTATGSAPNRGATTGAYDFTGTATGARPSNGSAAGGVDWTGSATGSRASQGATTGGYDFTGTAVGEQPPNGGSASGTYDFSGSATGVSPAVGVNDGEAFGTYDFTGAATGSAPRGGTATGTVSWAGTSTGARASQGSTSGTVSWAGSATGVMPTVGAREGSATGSFDFSGSAAGSAPKGGAASGGYDFTGTAAGSRASAGAATGSVAWDGTASGLSELVPITYAKATGRVYIATASGGTRATTASGTVRTYAASGGLR